MQGPQVTESLPQELKGSCLSAWSVLAQESKEPWDLGKAPHPGLGAAKAQPCSVSGNEPLGKGAGEGERHSGHREQRVRRPVQGEGWSQREQRWGRGPRLWSVSTGHGGPCGRF